LNARSKSFGSGEASTSRAISMKRLWRSASVSFGLRFFLGVMRLEPNLWVKLKQIHYSSDKSGDNGTYEQRPHDFLSVARLIRIVRVYSHINAALRSGFASAAKEI